MDTKRCPRCQKLLRAEAHSCSRCRYVFSQTPVGRSGKPTNGSRRSDSASLPFNPPASPHRAGHYSGLHPEDQPFQSSFMPVLHAQDALRPPAITRHLVEQEPAEVPLPAVTALSAAPAAEQPLPEQLPKREVASPSPLPLPMPQRHLGSRSQLPVPEPQRQFMAPVAQPLPHEPVMYQQVLMSAAEAAPFPRKRRLHDRIVPVLLIASCVLFLLATSILAFLLLGRRPVTSSEQPASKANPAVQQTLSTPAKLQLPVSQIDLGVDLIGPISYKTITLTAAGSGQVNWWAVSDSPWLTINPKSGTFSGSTPVTLTVDRTNLAPEAYTGHAAFYQQGNNTPLKLIVTMAVKAPAHLSLAPASLTFNGTTAQNPFSQPLIVQNTGGQVLDWAAIIGTSTGGNWLNASIVSGHLAANSQQTIIVSANSLGLSVGSYQGSLTFSYAGGTPSQVLVVTMIVNLPPAPSMVVKSTALTFSTIQGTNPAPQTFTIANTGNAPLNWAIKEDQKAGVFAPVSPASGTVAPGKSVTITVTPNVAQATAGVINGVITISDTDKGSPVQDQRVTVTITINNQAVITVSETTFTFNHTSIITNSTTLLVITNTGSAPLNWAFSQPMPSWLTVDMPAGTLAPGTSALIDVTCDSSGLPPGSYTHTLVVSDTDAGTPVTPQNIQVNLTIT